MRTKIQNRLKELNEELARHLESMGHKSEEWYNSSTAEGKWSPCQLHRHLMLSEGLSAKYVAVKSQYPEKLEEAGLQEKVNLEQLNIYLNSTKKFDAPETVVPDNAPGSLSLTVDSWMQQRMELSGLIDSLDESLLSKSLYKHPFAGRLSLLGMLDFFHWHLQRHESQIRY